MATPPSTTTAKVTSRIGSCSGSDSQLRRPNSSLVRSVGSDIRLYFCSVIGREAIVAASAAVQTWASGRQFSAADAGACPPP